MQRTQLATCRADLTELVEVEELSAAEAQQATFRAELIELTEEGKQSAQQTYHQEATRRSAAGADDDSSPEQGSSVHGDIVDDLAELTSELLDVTTQLSELAAREIKLNTGDTNKDVEAITLDDEDIQEVRKQIELTEDKIHALLPNTIPVARESVGEVSKDQCRDARSQSKAGPALEDNKEMEEEIHGKYEIEKIRSLQNPVLKSEDTHLLAFDEDYDLDDDDAHHHFVVRQRPRPQKAALLDTFQFVLGTPKTLPAAEGSSSDLWEWNNQNFTIRVDDSIIWKWKAGPLIVHSSDSTFRPLLPTHPCASSSGLPAAKGTWRVKLHVPGTYYFSSISGDFSSIDKPRPAGTIVVLTEFQKARRDLLQNFPRATAVFAGFLILTVGVLYTLTSTVWKEGFEWEASNQEPLRAVVLKLLPTVLLQIIPPAASGLVILIMLAPLAVIRTLKNPLLISFGRGYSRRTHSIVGIFVVGVMLLVLGAIVWGWSKF